MDNSFQKLPRGDVESDLGLSLRLWARTSGGPLRTHHHVIKVNIRLSDDWEKGSNREKRGSFQSLESVRLTLLGGISAL
jgi:hypothetical protein